MFITTGSTPALGEDNRQQSSSKSSDRPATSTVVFSVNLIMSFNVTRKEWDHA